MGSIPEPVQPPNAPLEMVSFGAASQCSPTARLIIVDIMFFILIRVDVRIG